MDIPQRQVSYGFADAQRERAAVHWLATLPQDPQRGYGAGRSGSDSKK
jgi:hypothetical protein